MWEVGYKRSADKDWQLVLEQGAPVRVGTVVNAAGAWADEVGALFGARPIGLVPHRRSAFTFAPPPGMATAHWQSGSAWVTADRWRPAAIVSLRPAAAKWTAPVAARMIDPLPAA